MSIFDFMEFSGGCGDEFVVHAKKFTKEEAVELWRSELDMADTDVSLVEENYVKYYVRVPEWCGYETEGGCYTYCSKGARGSFPVWVIRLGEEE